LIEAPVRASNKTKSNYNYKTDWLMQRKKANRYLKGALDALARVIAKHEI
jgi:hypothetical protein